MSGRGTLGTAGLGGAFGRALGGALAAVAALGCVRVDPGPNGVAAARLDATAPSIVAGDQLRDSLGAVTTLRAVVFNEAGQPSATAPLRFTYVPTLRDSLGRPVQDTALVVDSLTGAVRATLPFVLAQGLVAVRVSDRVQLVDTLAIVPSPDSVVADVAAVPLVNFLCTDPAVVPSVPLAGGDTVPGIFRNASAPFGVVVRGDSAGRRVPVRQRLVRWTIVSPAGLPAVRVPGGTAADTVPVLAVTDSAVDARLRFDTTDGAGRSAVRLRLRPTGLGSSVITASEFVVRLRADVQPGRVTLRNSPVFVDVRLRRNAPAAATCP